MASPRLLVEALPFTPLPYGLLSVAEPLNDGTSHWQNGITYEARCGTAGATYDECLVLVEGSNELVPQTLEPDAKEATVTGEIRGALPFTVYAEFDCSPVGDETVTGMATEYLTRSEAYRVEQAFWTGVVPQGVPQQTVYPHLAGDANLVDGDGVLFQTAADDVTPGGGATDATTGLGLLEAALADCYHGVGVIHVPRLALPALLAWGLVERSGSQLRTMSGNLVAAGSGYTGTAPDGTDPAAGSTYLYATSAVGMRRSAVRVPPPGSLGFDRATNTVHGIAERTYVLNYECCLAAVNIQLGVPT